MMMMMMMMMTNLWMVMMMIVSPVDDDDDDEGDDSPVDGDDWSKNEKNQKIINSKDVCTAGRSMVETRSSDKYFNLDICVV